MNTTPLLVVIGYVWPEPNSSAAGSRMLSLLKLYLAQGWRVMFASAAEQGEVYLTAPGQVEEMVEDYAATGISLKYHPLALLRQAGKLLRSVAVSELGRVRHKSPVRVSGLVTLRQRPGTAAGVTFMSLEDETGTANVVVWRATALAQQKSGI